MSDIAVIPTPVRSPEEQAIEIFRTHFPILDRDDIDLHTALRFLRGRPFTFVTTPDTPHVPAGCMFGGTIITPQLSWTRFRHSVSELMFYLSVSAQPIVKLRPYDPKKSQWRAIKRNHEDTRDEIYGLGVLYLD